ncbi:hypothetical protein WNY37_16525 [Henriciella sp. AS95]|uniref:hypothetical protein n=1 Tax=Henriciella sp. AS95 TaxID=3135782 RepID=UPI00316B88B0
MMFPRTKVMAVPPKQASLDDQKKKNKRNASYSVYTDPKIEPAKRRFTQSQLEVLYRLTDGSVTGEEVLQHRNRKLFVAKGSWGHLNISQLIDGLQKFVANARAVNPKNRTLYVGPNLIKRPEIDDIVSGDPTSPFIYLRAHNVVRAATALQFRPVTNYTDDHVSTKDGFLDGMLIASIWSANAALVKDIYDMATPDELAAMINNLWHKHNASVSRTFFEDRIFPELSADGRRERKGYGITKKLADALYIELKTIAEAHTSSIPPFGLMFPHDHDRTHANGRRVFCLSSSDGNLV